MGNYNRAYSTKPLFHLINHKNSQAIKQTEGKAPEISKELHETIIGLILGDLYVRRRFKNSCLCFKGSDKHKQAALQLYSLFKPFCNSAPKIVPAKVGEKTHHSVIFDTLTSEKFNYYHVSLCDKIKRVPTNIGELLTARGLAYWAMDDGGSDRSGFIFYTNSFTKEEVILLIKVLKDNFDFVALRLYSKR